MAQIATDKTTILTIAVISLSLVSVSDAFSWTCLPIQLVRETRTSQDPFSNNNRHHHRHHHRQPRTRKLPVALFAKESGDKGITVQETVDDVETKEEEDVVVKALGPASSSANSADQQDTDTSLGETNTATNQVFMITQEMKRAMVEELGYKRKEVDSIRVELVSNIIENRIGCPSEGMPADWVDRDRESINSVGGNLNMMERLESESKYPLKFPLLAVSLNIFGKGFSDALITLIKVNNGFPGASLTAQFQGIPVLAIDIVCVMVGAGLGLWTWKTMK